MDSSLSAERSIGAHDITSPSEESSDPEWNPSREVDFDAEIFGESGESALLI